MKLHINNLIKYENWTCLSIRIGINASHFINRKILFELREMIMYCKPSLLTMLRDEYSLDPRPFKGNRNSDFVCWSYWHVDVRCTSNIAYQFPNISFSVLTGSLYSVYISDIHLRNNFVMTLIMVKASVRASKSRQCYLCVGSEPLTEDAPLYSLHHNRQW